MDIQGTSLSDAIVTGGSIGGPHELTEDFQVVPDGGSGGSDAVTNSQAGVGASTLGGGEPANIQAQIQATIVQLREVLTRLIAKLTADLAPGGTGSSARTTASGGGNAASTTATAHHATGTAHTATQATTAKKPAATAAKAKTAAAATPAKPKTAAKTKTAAKKPAADPTPAKAESNANQTVKGSKKKNTAAKAGKK